MELSFGFRDLKNPKKMLLLGIVLLVIGVFMFVGLDWNEGVTRDSCVVLEVTFDDCKYHSVEGGIDSNDIYLTFQDYFTNLDIHPSCANDKLTQELMELRSGTKMKIVTSEETLHIYELSVGGETWLAFDDAMEKISSNMVWVKCIGYVSLMVGTVFVLTVIVSFLWGLIKRRKLDDAPQNSLLLK